MKIEGYIPLASLFTTHMHYTSSDIELPFQLMYMYNVAHHNLSDLFFIEQPCRPILLLVWWWEERFSHLCHGGTDHSCGEAKGGGEIDG